jgi:two-component system, response regulator
MLEVEQVEILLVEDKALDAELMMRSLSDEKLANNIVWLQDGQQALDYLFRQGEYAQRSAPDPRLILLDLKMPRVDGVEVLRALKANEHTKRIPYDLGANSYVVKPIDFDTLCSVARNAGFYWLAINRYASS